MVTSHGWWKMIVKMLKAIVSCGGCEKFLFYSLLKYRGDSELIIISPYYTQSRFIRSAKICFFLLLYVHLQGTKEDSKKDENEL